MTDTQETKKLDAFQQWLEKMLSVWNVALNNEFSPSTIANYRSHVSTLNKRLVEYGIFSDLFSEDDPEKVKEYYQALLQVPAIASVKGRKGKDINAGTEKYCDYLTYQRDFDWIPFFQELAEKLRDYENRQSDLMNVLRTADVDVGTKDRVEGEMVDLMEIDPFSFFGLCLKYRKKEKRKAIFTELKDYFELTAAVPSTYNGVPNSNPQQVWLFAYQHERKPEDIPLLWNLYKMAINKEVSNQVFKKALDIKNVGTSKLTQSLFYLDPFSYLPINAQTIPYLKKWGIPYEFDSWEEYQNILKQVVATIKKPFYQISYDAWLEDHEDEEQAWAYLGSSKEIGKYVGSIQDKIAATGYCAIPWSHRFKEEKAYFDQNKPFRFYLYENDHKPLRFYYWVTDFVTSKKAIVCPSDWEEYLRTEEEKQTTRTGGFDRQTWMLVEKVEVIDQPIPFNELKPHPKSSLNGGKLRSAVALILDPLGPIEIGEIEQEESFRNTLRSFSRNDLEFYFEQSKSLLDQLSIAPGDQRMVYACYPDRLPIIIGQRYCLAIYSRAKNKKWHFISNERIDHPQIHENMEYKRGPEAYFYETDQNQSLTDYFEQIREALGNELNRTQLSGFSKYNNPYLEKAIFDLSYQQQILDQVFSIKKMGRTIPLNQILYGPPGTGKTYQTKALAVKILTEEVFEHRADTNKRYNELYKEGLIKFVTFHQSTSYEDFVEGIKPIMENEEEEIGNLSYSIKEGIFKRMCVEAAYEYIKQQQPGEAAAKALTFGQLYENLFNRYQEQLDEDEEIKIPLKAGNEVSVINLSSQGNFILQHKDGQRSYTVSKARLEKLYNAIDDFETIPNIYTYFRSIIGGSNASAYWAILNQIVQLELPQGIPTVPNTVSYEDKQKAFERIDWQSIDTDIDVPAYVLIIDEINRGNIASILGELITLLEEDKRGGQKEGLEVMLPYSKSNFSVPPNLYIIGTMNTADRSVEALDTALRRRFSFTEIAPDPSLLQELIVEGIELETLLRTINKRIEKLLDKDHMIGHGDLIQLKDEENKTSRLKHIFQHKILPLLQEYFYGNLGKIQLILGSAFVALEPEDNAITFAKNIDYEGDEYLDRSIYRIENVEEMHDDAFIQAVKAIYS